MSKAVMLSIRPKWCEKIANGEKTIEVRKTRPKLETPFKCYIYCTIDGIKKMPKDYIAESVERGKVIGEFTCDRIYELAPLNHAPDDVEKQACLTREEIVNYLKGAGYGWHITDLRIYDEARKLSEFWRATDPCDSCHAEYTWECTGCKKLSGDIKHAPQSWCYVEAMDNG